ncbi:adhesion G protein-coupled receptor L2-like [Branchiostoma floridae x Branchiostoma belcheri]
MMTFHARYRGMLLLLAMGGTAILQSSAAPEKRDPSVAEKVDSFVRRLEELIDREVDGDEDTMDMMEKNGGGTEEFGGDSWLPKTRQVGGTSRLRRVCEHQTLTIGCPAGRQINIVSALYGRTSRRGVCPSGPIRTTNCRSPNSQVWVRGKCQGRSSCSVRVSNSVFGDPCVGVGPFKYLGVSYTCIGKWQRKLTV